MIYLTKTKTAERDTKDTSTHISQCNSLSLKEKDHNVGLYIMHIYTYIFTNVPVYYLKKEDSENKMKEKCLCARWGGGGG